jgi:hypothetical protein
MLRLNFQCVIVVAMAVHVEEVEEVLGGKKAGYHCWDGTRTSMYIKMDPIILLTNANGIDLSNEFGLSIPKLKTFLQSASEIESSNKTQRTNRRRSLH